MFAELSPPRCATSQLDTKADLSARLAWVQDAGKLLPGQTALAPTPPTQSRCRPSACYSMRQSLVTFAVEHRRGLSGYCGMRVLQTSSRPGLRGDADGRDALPLKATRAARNTNQNTMIRPLLIAAPLTRIATAALSNSQSLNTFRPQTPKIGCADSADFLAAHGDTGRTRTSCVRLVTAPDAASMTTTKLDHA